MLKTTKELLSEAQNKGYAVPQFNVYNLETLRSVVEAAEEMNSPVILAVTPGTRRFSGDAYMHALAHTAAKVSSVPIAYHLDHHTSIVDVVPSLKLGAKSIMIDASMETFENNVRIVKEAVETAHGYGASVEGELGKLIGTEEDITVEEGEDALTDPEMAKEFVERTGVDTLAVAIGTAHGLYKSKPNLDFDRLKKIREAVDVPLVLHGASGVSEEDVRKCIAYGVSKVNIATELKIPFAEALRDYFKAHPNEQDPRKYFTPAKEALKEVVLQKIRMCKSEGKAL